MDMTDLPETINQTMPDIVNLDGWLVEPTRRRVTDTQGAQVKMTAIEFDILMILIEGQGKPVHRDAISMSIKGKVVMPEDRSIDMAVSRVRKKLGGGGRQSAFIQTVRNGGYRLTVPVSFLG
jgi:two-component system OmpR family response regulator